MDKIRRKKLERNSLVLFWIKAFFSANILGVVIVLFYLHRGLTLSQVFYLAIIWSVVTLIFEIPSSYMADKWGRKKTLIFGGLCMLLSKFLLFWASSFLWFAGIIALTSLYFAAFSGTDEALLYDTGKELGKKDSVKKTTIEVKIIGFIIVLILLFKNSKTKANTKPTYTVLPVNKEPEAIIKKATPPHKPPFFCKILYIHIRNTMV